MNVQVVFLPRELRPAQASGRTVVVFDVLRATTTMAAALAAGIKEIRVFDNLESAKIAADRFSGPKLLCGELNCLAPPGFDLGNSPGQWTDACKAWAEKAKCAESDRLGSGGVGAGGVGLDAVKLGGAELTAFMSTTNGTRAIVAAALLKPKKLFVGAMINARAIALAAAEPGEDITLLCSGTAGEVSIEDILGAGAVMAELETIGLWEAAGDGAQIARRLFTQSRDDLPAALHGGAGGRNLARANLSVDVEYCAKLNALTAVGEVREEPLRVQLYPHVRLQA